MARHVIDYKSVDMEKEEFEYYEKLVKEFTFDSYSGKEQFRNIFEVDEDGCITIIKPPLNKEIAWAIILFLMNLMINQRVRRMEKKVEEFIKKCEQKL